MSSITVTTLFSEFKKTREYIRLAYKSKVTYDGMMRKAETDYFLLPNRVSLITERTVDALYEKLMNDKRHSHANMFMKVMRRIWSVMRRKGLVKNNPFREMGLEKTEPRMVRWTKEQLDSYFTTIKRLGHTELYLISRLCYLLGQRPGDMMTLGKKNFTSDFTKVEFVTQKTKKKIILPIMDDEIIRMLKARFKTADVLSTLNSQELSRLHRDTLIAAGITDKVQIRDLRRTALMEVFEAGGSDAEGQAITGHSDRSLDDMLNVYSPYTYQMAENAMRKRFGLTNS